MYISIEQALDVYGELYDAFNGVNSFGGNEALIYAYRVMPYSPLYSMHEEGTVWDEDNRMLEKKAAEDFHSICHIFSKKYDASVEINSIPLNDWIIKIRIGEERFYSKVIVKVINNKINKNEESNSQQI